MTTVNIPHDLYLKMKTHFEVLEKTYAAHTGLSNHEELIEPWTPSDWDEAEQISCPDLTVGFLEEALNIKRDLKL